jgi:hypothetical protein
VWLVCPSGQVSVRSKPYHESAGGVDPEVTSSRCAKRPALPTEVETQAISELLSPAPAHQLRVWAVPTA